MTALRERIAQYRRADGFPEPPEWYEPPQWVRVTGTLIVMVVAFVATMPAAGLLLALATIVPNPIMLVVGLVLLPVSMKAGQYIGAPVADHVLGIPREVSD